MDGILIIDKPANMTSRDVVNKISKIYNTKKVGHTGTLDPLATGVLVVCINRATKIVDLLTSLNKEYIAEFALGTLTDSLDVEGKIIDKRETNFSKELVLKALEQIKGPYIQTVPIYSAVKVNGKKLYEYAREHVDVQLPKHNVIINEIELLDIKQIDNQTNIKIRANVSKGTYIRSLGEDIANILNTHSTMTSLKRTKQGEFLIENSCKLDNINSNTKLISIKDCLNDYFKFIANKELEEDILDGKILNNLYNKEYILFVDTSNNPIALYKKYEKDMTKIKPWKMFKIR